MQVLSTFMITKKNKEMILNKRNASKFARFYVSENPCIFFSFFILCNFYFYQMKSMSTFTQENVFAKYKNGRI